MKLRVRIPGHLSEYVAVAAYQASGGRADDFYLETAGPVSVSDLMRRIGLRPELAIGALFRGQRVNKEALLEEDGEVIILSPIAGGEGGAGRYGDSEGSGGGGA